MKTETKTVFTWVAYSDRRPFLRVGEVAGPLKWYQYDRQYAARVVFEVQEGTEVVVQRGTGPLAPGCTEYRAILEARLPDGRRVRWGGGGPRFMGILRVYDE